MGRPEIFVQLGYDRMRSEQKLKHSYLTFRTVSVCAVLEMYCWTDWYILK